MKNLSTYVLLGGLMIGIGRVSEAARIHAWISINPFPLVVAVQPAPVVVERPVHERVVVEDPYAAPPPPDYRQELVDFHTRAQRLQRLLDRQLNRGIISQERYDHHAGTLDEIIREEQRDAARHNGSLTPREVDSLSRRLRILQDDVHEDLAR